MLRSKSPGAGTGPPPCVALGVAVVNALTANTGKGAKSAAAAGTGKATK